MPPFRMLHVAGVDLAAVIARPPHELADLCEAAPGDALRRIAEMAAAHQVAAILLMPVANEGGPELLDLGALDRLHYFLARLREHGISLIIAAGDQRRAWQRLLGRNLLGRDNEVALLADGECLDLRDRHGRTHVELQGISTIGDHGDRRPARKEEPIFTLAVAPRLGMAELGDEVHDKNNNDNTNRRRWDYLALGRGGRRTEQLGRCLVHCPGPPQATMRRQRGPHGVTLLNVGGAGELQTEFLSAASVRFESWEITASDVDEKLGDVASRMNERLEEVLRAADERGWIVSWTIHASRRWFSRLASPAERGRLLALLPARREDLVLAHEISLVPDTADAVDNPFFIAFEAALAARRDHLTTVEGRMALFGRVGEGKHGWRIEQLLAACHDQEVINRARRHGQRFAEAANQKGE